MTSRRVFIKSGAAAMLSLGFAPSFLERTVLAAAPRRRLLIALFQRGAVDGLNMVVPYGDAEYYRLRRSIAIGRPGGDDAAIDLNGFFGLHPRMAPLKPLWDDGMLAAVQACGSPDATRSHFDAQDFMESATPGVKSTRDGWLNRYLQSSGNQATPLRGVALAKQMPRSLQGRAPALAFAGVGAFDVRGGKEAEAALEKQYQQTADPLLTSRARDAFDAMRVVRAATSGVYQPAAGVEYPRSPFGNALQEIARLAKADVGLEVAFAECGGWDNHVNQGGATGQLAGRLDDLSRSIAALVQDLGPRMADTVIVTMSEFGRAAAENGSRGTDHGHGNAMLVIGGPVKGRQVYGRWPGLGEAERFDGRDLAVTTDFRQVFNEVVTGHLGATPDAAARVFPGFTSEAGLGLIRT